MSVKPLGSDLRIIIILRNLISNILLKQINDEQVLDGLSGGVRGRGVWWASFHINTPGHAGLHNYIIRQLARAHTFMLLVCLLFAVMHAAD